MTRAELLEELRKFHAHCLTIRGLLTGVPSDAKLQRATDGFNRLLAYADVDIEDLIDSIELEGYGRRAEGARVAATNAAVSK